MKLVSLIALTAALAMSAPTLTYAQAATASGTASGAASGAADATAGDASAGAEVDANVDAGVDASIDSDGDGQISVEEQAAADAAAEGNAGIDTDGDGLISEEEQAAADAAGIGDTMTCPDTGLESLTGMQGAVDEASITAATTARVVLVSECEAGDVSAALAGTGATALRTSIGANAALTAQIQARGATTADIIGAAMVGDVLTIYVSDDDTDA